MFSAVDAMRSRVALKAEGDGREVAGLPARSAAIDDVMHMGEGVAADDAAAIHAQLSDAAHVTLSG